MSRRGWLLFVAMCLIWGIPYLLIKVAVSELSPVTITFLRTGIGALSLLPVALVRGELRPLLRRWKWLLLYTATEVTVPFLLLPYAEQRLPSSLTGLLVAGTPLVGALLLLLLRGGDRLDLRQAGGLVIGLIGVAVLLGLNDLRGDLVAIGEVGVVVVGYALGPIIVARRLSDMPSTGVIAVSLGITSLVYAPLGIAQAPSHLPSATVLGAVLVLGFVCTALAYVVFFRLIAAVGPARAETVTYVNPAVALGLGVLLLGEPFTVGAVIGFVLIVGGLLLATRRSHAKSPRVNAAKKAGAAAPASR